MNMKQMKNMISQFRSADLSLIKDADKRAKAQKLQAKQGGFTLLELLVVVAILAIIAGAVISSLDGQEELAAQKTTVHTMAALEEGFAIYKATAKRTLPGGLDSLLCQSDVAASNAPVALGAITFVNTTPLGGSSNVARVGGGMTEDLASGLVRTDMASGAVRALTDAGLTSLRYVDGTACDDPDNVSLGATFGAPIQGEELVEVVKPNLIFRAPIVEGTEWEFGAGVAMDLSDYDDVTTVPMAVMAETAEITGAENDAIVVFGIGPDSDIVGNIVARAPSDGNGGPDKYSNFSVAVKIGACEDENEGFSDGSGGINAACDIEYETPKVVAILDAGGDAYDDEVAEARGNQEE